MSYLASPGREGVARRQRFPSPLWHRVWCVCAGGLEGGVPGHQRPQNWPEVTQRESGRAGLEGCDSGQTQRLSAASLLTHTPSSASSSVFLLALLPAPALSSNPAGSPRGRRGLGREVVSARPKVGKGVSCPA